MSVPPNIDDQHPTVHYTGTWDHMKNQTGAINRSLSSNAGSGGTFAVVFSIPAGSRAYHISRHSQAISDIKCSLILQPKSPSLFVLAHCRKLTLKGRVASTQEARHPSPLVAALLAFLACLRAILGSLLLQTTHWLLKNYLLTAPFLSSLTISALMQLPMSLPAHQLPSGLQHLIPPHHLSPSKILLLQLHLQLQRLLVVKQ